MLNFLSMNDMLIFDAIRAIFAGIDRLIYSLISLVYEIIIEISNVQIFSDQTIGEFSGRLYTLIGIFMLFKLSFSIITYIINPDSVFDKEKGGTKLLVNIVLTFGMIILAPTVFTLLGDAQNAILKDHVIENFILGTNGELSSNEFMISEKCKDYNYSPLNITDEGDYIALVVFRPFYQIDPNGRDPEGFVASSSYCNARSVKQLLKADLYNSPTTASAGSGVMGNYNIDYGFIVSTLVGGVVALILIGFAMDVAVRAIKLSFLQIIAPIPIMSYIDPSKAKNGMFKKWLTEVGKTWADLFIKLIALYFVLKVITMLDDVTAQFDNVEHKIWVPILIIIGGLIFAKQLPTLIGNMLGIKLDGGFNVNPLKKFEKEAMGSKALAATGGMISGMAGGFIAGRAAGKNVGNVGKGIAAGMLSGAAYGRKNPQGAFTKSMDNAYKSLTGNEMAKFDFTKVMMGGGTKEVGEIKDYLKAANDDLRAEETKLGIASHTSAQMGTSLRSRGIDLNDLDTAKSNLMAESNNLLNARNSARELYSNSQSAFDNYQRKYLEAENYIKNNKPTAFYDDGTPVLSEQYKEYQNFIANYENNKRILENELNNAMQNYQTSENNYRNNTEALNEIDTYLTAIADEKEIRANIQSINKTISTLADEKKQRERFYHYDSSPKEDVNKAIEKTKKHDYK